MAMQVWYHKIWLYFKETHGLSDDLIKLNHNGAEYDFGPFVVQFTAWFETRFSNDELEYLGDIPSNYNLWFKSLIV